MKDNPFILWFKEIDPENKKLIGLKCAGLGKMVASGFPIPNGFCVTSFAYRQFLKRTGLILKIKSILENRDFRDPRNLGDSAQKIKKLFSSTAVPDEIAGVIMKNYLKLGGFLKEALVAARSSTTNEELATSSYLNIKGEANLVEAVRNCWASIFVPENFSKKKNTLEEKMAVLVQRMVQSRVSGVIFSTDPDNKKEIIIRAVYGLGELAIKGAVVPDEYHIRKKTFKITERQVVPQLVQLIKVGTSNKQTEVPKNKQNSQKLTDQEIIQLAKLANKIQHEYYFPQEIEFAIESRKIYILQTRPITKAEIGSHQNLLRQRQKKISPKKENRPLKTATKIYVNLQNPVMAREIASENIDGVLFQPEFLVSQIGIHPKKLIYDRRKKILFKKLSDGLGEICQAFNPRPVIYKALDFKTDEYCHLIGGKTYEPEEANPLLGFHGCIKAIADPKVFELELEVIEEVKKRKKLRNLSLVLPFIRTVRDLQEIKKIVTGHGLMRTTSFKLWLMLEVPSNIFLLEDFIKVGIDGFCLRLPELLTLTLAIDEENRDVFLRMAEPDFYIEDIFKKILKINQKYNKLTNLAWIQDYFLYSSLLEKFIKSGIKGITVSSESIPRIRELVYGIERELIK